MLNKDFESIDFEKLPEIKSINDYIDKAVKSAKKDALNAVKQIKKKSKIEIIKNRVKVITTAEVLKNELLNILNSYPKIDKMHKFYYELLKLKLNPVEIKKTFAKIKWSIDKIQDFKEKYKNKPNSFKEFLGRVSSLLKDSDLEVIRKLRIQLRKFPQIKIVPTIALLGLPNVGKSTFLKRFTKANPEIKDYQFTTKKLQFGYFMPYKLQIIDCPGMLDRPFEKMNAIEKQAYLVIKYIASKYFFIIDPTQDLKVQINLLSRVLDKINEVYIIVNKIDIINENINEVVENHINKLKPEKKEKIKKILYVSLLKDINTDAIEKLMEKLYFKTLRELRENAKQKETT